MTTAPTVATRFSVVQPSAGRVVGDPARHPVVAEHELREERQVRPEHEQPEVHASEPLASRRPVTFGHQ